MKKCLILLFLIPYSLSLLAQPAAPMGRQDSAGFTDKSEAKNQMVDSAKDGKWCEYLNDSLKIVNDTNAPHYVLITYKAGKPNGMKRIYRKDGKLEREIPYTDGVINGIERTYFKNGKLQHEHPYTNGKLNINGVSREYADNGQLVEEIPYTNGQVNGTVKEFYKSGQLMTIAKYTNGEQTDTTSFDENGNVMKE